MSTQTNTTNYVISNTFETYGDPLPVRCAADAVESTLREIATRIAGCYWPTAVDGMVDMTQLLQQRDERDEPETGISNEVDHCNDVLDAAEENGGMLPFADLVAMIASDALEVEELDNDDDDNA